MKMRTFTITAYIFFGLIQITDGIALPPEVIAHPIVKRLEMATNYVTIYINDILSVAKEIQEGTSHNLVFILQQSYQISLQEAINRAAELHDIEVQTFIQLSTQLPSFGAEIDANLQRYISSLRFWMRGNRPLAELR